MYRHALVLIILGIVLFSSAMVSAQSAQPATSPVASAQPTQPAASPVASAQPAQSAASPVVLTVSNAWSDGNRHPAPPPKPGATPEYDTLFADARLRNRIWIEVEHLADFAQKNNINPRDLVLYVNGQELKGTNAVAVEGPQQNWLGFDLIKNTESNPIWRNLLGSPTSEYRLVRVSVGLPNQQAVAPTQGKPNPVIYLRLFYWRWVIISLIGLILVVFFFVRFARRGHLIHDSDPPDLPPAQKPYSLALTQAAWWFFFVIGSFAFIYIITGDYNTITDQALVLIGIGTGTALGAFMINATKRNTADTDLSTLNPAKAKLEAEINQLKLGTDTITLAEKQAQLSELDKKIDNAKALKSKPESEGFLNDLLTDINGITLHRFQMLVWTIVLGIIFAIGVYRNLAMPDFNTTLLALLGISAGTYLGFKIPERQG